MVPIYFINILFSNNYNKILQYIIKNNINVNQQFNCNEIPSIYLSFFTNQKINEYDQKIDFTPLTLSVLNNNKDLTKFLLDHKKSISLNFTVDMNILLHYSCLFKFNRMLELLLNYDFNPNFQDNQSQTPIFLAVQNNDIDSIKILLKYKINVNHQRNSKSTPLYIACQNGYVDCAKLLLKNGANPFIYNDFGNTSLHVACISNKFAIINLIMSYKQNIHDFDKFINFQNKLLKTPLNLSCTLNRVYIAEILVKNGADPNIYDKDNRLPIHYTSMKESYRLIKILLEHNSDFTIYDNINFTPLDYIWRNYCRQEYNDYETIMNIILLFLTYGDNPNKIKYKNIDFTIKVHNNIKLFLDLSKNWTPLHFACFRRDEKKVKLLLNSDQGNIDKEKKVGNPNMKPLDIAKKMDYPLANSINEEIITLLSPSLIKVNISNKKCYAGGGGGGTSC